MKRVIAVLLALVLSGCTLTTTQTTKQANCPPIGASTLWAGDGAHWYNRDERSDGRCAMDPDTKVQVILISVVAGLGLAVGIPLIVWAVTTGNTKNGGGGGCTKCKVIKTRSDGVRQAYWVCC